MSDPRIADSDRDVWVHALSTLHSLALDLTTAGVLDHLRHLIVTGRLVDREAIDIEKAYTLASMRGIDMPADVDWFFAELGLTDDSG